MARPYLAASSVIPKLPFEENRNLTQELQEAFIWVSSGMEDEDFAALEAGPTATG